MNGDHPPDHPDILPENAVAALPNEQEAEDYHLSDSFLAALDALTLGDTRMQSLHCLPFLLRNLRTGFQYRCHLCGIDTNIEVPPTAPITVIYSIRSAAENELGADSDVHIIEMSAWNCPLCKFHGTFKTKEILGKHLLWDHPTVGIIWTQDEDDLRLTLEIPSAEVTVAQQLTPQFEYAGPLPIVVPATPEFASNVASNDDLDAQMPIAATSQIEHVQPLPTTVSTSLEFASNAAHKPEADTQMPQITVKPSYQEPPQTTPSEAATIEDDMKFKIRRDSPTPNPSRSSSRTFVGTSRATSRTSLHSSNKSTTPSAQPSRYPTPPPPTDPLGASAQFPYLPGDNSDALYSCRIGGPRLYDLLNTMSLDEFGVLSWVIVDREEEMFEVDDVRDEDKVMQALWTRWIFLNRNLFVANYPRGMRAFVEQNWRMIHRAAGWAALRQWLMIFMTHKFLSPVDIVEILKYYQGLTGMRHWYDAGGSQRDVSVGSDMTH
ncbi:hypothetical protein BJ138DRAFT_222271 [Hygrophoropsis aurantiaca]|uniref:Uncharacterized protein n=1 Tax=Hygrophoropsis aurantiaca TaxID=72124 RepID=A0ACB8AP29_9AGAM|nr:hypothetical protein BJ138DRAFT_222271 [Hygrophoropsis aurantiaca]